MTLLRPSVALTLALTAALAGCADPSNGSNDPNDGTDPLTGDGEPAALMVGRTAAGDRDAVNAAAATTVEIAAVLDGGQLETLATANVQADGSWSAWVEPERQRIVVVAKDGADVAGHALVATTGMAGETVFTPPITTETDLEAQTFLAVVSDGRAVAETDPVDVRARIDAATAAAFEGLDADAQGKAVSALAVAVDAAQETETEAAAAFGRAIDQRDRFLATIDASRELDGDLYTGTAMADAVARFGANIDGALQDEGIDTELRSRIGAWAGSAWRLALTHSDADPMVVDAAVVGSAVLEARWTTNATIAAVQKSGASADVMGSATQTCAALQAAVATASDADAAARAYADFEAAVVGSAAPMGTLVAQVAGLELTDLPAASATLVAATEAAVTLEEDLDAAVLAAAEANDRIDATAMARGTVEAWTTYRDTLTAAVLTSNVLGETQATTELVIEATGSFRAAQ